MIAGRVIKKIVCAMAVLLAAYVASYVVLRAVNYIHVIGGVGLGGNGYQVECCWLDSTGKPRFYTVGTVVLHFFWPCWQIECEMKMRSSANKRGAGKGGIAVLRRAGRAWPALPDRERWVAMRLFSAVLLALMLVATGALGADSTNEFTLFKHQGRRQAYEWRISEARVAATPKWNMDRAKVPVAPDKAWRMAKDWFKKQGKLEPDFVRMEIRPFVINSALGSEGRRRLGSLLDRYYYRIECIPAAFDSMLVVVLMDGTVLEPVRIADLPLEEIK